MGLGYALDSARKTVLRASFARYASQLSFGDVAGSTGENPVGVSYLQYQWIDANHDRLVQPGEVDFSHFVTSSNVDPAHPAAVGTTVNKVDRDLKAKHDNEFVLGVDRELGANFSIGAAYTWRKGTDYQYRPRLAGACSDPANPTIGTCPIIAPNQYTALAPVSGNGFTATPFAPNTALVTAGSSGRIRTNRPDYYTLFNGVELTATKRLSNKWMGRVAFSWNDWTEHWKDGVTPVNAIGSPTRLETDPLVNGGQVANLSGGSGKASFYTSVKWQVYANALVQLPWNFDLSGAVFGKQGGPYPINIRASNGRDSNQNMLATPEVDSKRYPNLFDVDLRLAKTIKFGSTGLTAAVEGFNLLNSGVVLSRSRQANTSTFVSTIAGAEPANQLGRIEEILSPRIVRLGLTFSF